MQEGKEKKRKYRLYKQQTCKATFVGMRNVMTAGEPKNNPFTLPSNSKECDRRPPLQKMVWKID